MTDILLQFFCGQYSRLKGNPQLKTGLFPTCDAMQSVSRADVVKVFERRRPMNSREYYDACHQVPSHESALFSRRRRDFLIVLISFAAEL